MSQPWESGVTDQTRAWCAYIGLASNLSGTSASNTVVNSSGSDVVDSAGNTVVTAGSAAGTATVASIKTWANSMARKNAAGGPLDVDFSAAFIDDGVTMLVASGWVSNSAGTLTPLFVTAAGAPRALRRESGNDNILELDPDTGKAERAIHP
jgi:hypothetical protein